MYWRRRSNGDLASNMRKSWHWRTLKELGDLEVSCFPQFLSSCYSGSWCSSQSIYMQWFRACSLHMRKPLISFSWAACVFSYCHRHWCRTSDMNYAESRLVRIYFPPSPSPSHSQSCTSTHYTLHLGSPPNQRRIRLSITLTVSAQLQLPCPILRHWY